MYKCGDGAHAQKTGLEYTQQNSSRIFWISLYLFIICQNTSHLSNLGKWNLCICSFFDSPLPIYSSPAKVQRSLFETAANGQAVIYFDRIVWGLMIPKFSSCFCIQCVAISFNPDRSSNARGFFLTSWIFPRPIQLPLDCWLKQRFILHGEYHCWPPAPFNFKSTICYCIRTQPRGGMYLVVHLRRPRNLQVGGDVQHNSR